MRIVLCCLPSMGGSAITTSALAQALAERGHQVAVVSGGPPFAIGSTAHPTEGSCRRDGVTYHWPQQTVHPVLDAGALGLLRTADLAGRVARDLRADVVNAHYLGGLLPGCALAVRAVAPTAALVASAHGTDVTDPAAGTEATTAGLLRSADSVTAVSPFLAQRMAETFMVPVQRIRVIPGWADEPPGATGPASGGPAELRLVHVSNLRVVKRAVRCVDALASAHAVTPSRLVLVGDGPDHAAVLVRAAALGLADRVEATGAVDPAAAHALLAGSDVVLLPSASEACSGVLLQALGAGIPAVAYDVGGNAGVVDNGRSGLLVPDEDDSDRFALAVAGLAGDPALRASLGQGARDGSRRFTRDRSVTAYEGLYAAAVTRRTRRLLRAS